jgi:hypothetical protein
MDVFCAVKARDPNALRAKHIELCYADFAGPWRGMERDKFVEMADVLIPDAVLVVWKIRTHALTLAQLNAREALESIQV